jgi:Rap1a immunity proteins
MRYSWGAILTAIEKADAQVKPDGGGCLMRRPLGGLILGMLYLLLGRAAGAEQYPEYEWQMGKELVRICQSQSPGDVGFCTGYIEGATAGRDVQYCFSAGVTAGQVREVVKLWLSENPEKWHLAAHDLVIEALKEKFPCNQP